MQRKVKVNQQSTSTAYARRKFYSYKMVCYTIDKRLPWTLTKSISTLAWPKGVLHSGRDLVLIVLGTVDSRAGLVLH